MSMEKDAQVARQRAGELLQALAQLPGHAAGRARAFHRGARAGAPARSSRRSSPARSRWPTWSSACTGASCARNAFASTSSTARASRRTRRATCCASCYDLAGIAVFGGAVLAIFYALYQGHEPTRLLVLTVIGAVVLFRLIVLGSRFLLEPRAPALRLLPFADAAARRIHSGVLQVAVLYLVGDLSGVPARAAGRVGGNGPGARTVRRRAAARRDDRDGLGGAPRCRRDDSRPGRGEPARAAGGRDLAGARDGISAPGVPRGISGRPGRARPRKARASSACCC